MCVYIYMYVCMYIYIYVESERDTRSKHASNRDGEREREREERASLPCLLWLAMREPKMTDVSTRRGMRLWACPLVALSTVIHIIPQDTGCLQG